MPFVRAVGLTNRGAVRPANEDCIVIDRWIEQRDMAAPLRLEMELDGAFLCAVADGMGGHAAGELASALAVRELSDKSRLIDDADRLDLVLREINQTLFAAMVENPTCAGMGTTLAGILICDTAILVFNIGDSRVYSFEGRTMELLTTDDTSAALTVSPRERTGLRGHQLLQCLGGSRRLEKIEPHVSVLSSSTLPLHFVLCSDGLTDMLDQDEIEGCIDEARGNSEQIAKNLYEAAMKKGGKDNFSVIVADVGSTNLWADIEAGLPAAETEESHETTARKIAYGIIFIMLATLLVMISPIARNYLKQSFAVKDYYQVLFIFLAVGIATQIGSDVVTRIAQHAPKFQRLFSAAANAILYAVVGTAFATLLSLAARRAHFSGLNFPDAGHYGAFLLGGVASIVGLWPPIWLSAPLRASFTPFKRLSLVVFAILAFCASFDLFGRL